MPLEGILKVTLDDQIDCGIASGPIKTSEVLQRKQPRVEKGPCSVIYSKSHYNRKYPS